MMRLVNVTKTYKQGSRTVNAVRGVDLTVPSGEFLAIMGPSGSGKSTLLHLLGALDTPTTGDVIFQEHHLQKMTDRQRSLLRRTKIGFVFQFFNLLPTLKGVENVALPLLLAGTRRKTALEKARVSLDRVGMGHRADHFPEEMSGGEMQRIAIARALVTEPTAILCDEPTGNLDSKTSREILQLLRSLPEEGKCSLVMVTHDRKAAEYGDRLVFIQDGVIAHEEDLRGVGDHLIAASA
ncbi:ABC transporter ATP-binding protein [Zavarzinella formosa]|uniref:ABC transporter ATP-binding protein n=1 Tax=Zavarzinella formosa TaxID=360055 RepID=UPI0002F9C30B|nr:ABC transporter ATP-binding protein [Zavarzinella formosa]